MKLVSCLLVNNVRVLLCLSKYIAVTNDSSSVVDERDVPTSQNASVPETLWKSLLHVLPIRKIRRVMLDPTRTESQHESEVHVL